MVIEEILIVKHNGHLYGLNTHNVEHILRVIPMTPVPLAPKAVIGLCAIEGSIVSILDLSLLLQEPELIDTTLPSARLITVHTKEMLYSVLTQEVINNITVKQDDIEYITDSEKHNDGVVAMYKYKGTIVQVLQIETLIDRIVLDDFSLKDVKNRTENFGNKEELNTKSRRYLLFGMGDESYGLEVSRIREVINMPKEFTSIADSAPEMIGMMTLREELIAVADLRTIYELSPTTSEENRIIIIQSEGKVMGAIVDNIIDIVDFPVAKIDNMPSNFKDDKIVGIANINDELVSLINIKIIDKVIQNELRIESNQDSKQVSSEEVTTEVVTFSLDVNEYAFKTEEVIEIIDAFEVTDIPDMPEMVEGVTNIRGRVIPIVKLYEKLELREIESDHKKLIVCQLNNSPVGIVVDKVTNVKNMENSLFIVEEESPYFTHVIKEKEGVVLMINLSEIFSTFLKEA